MIESIAGAIGGVKGAMDIAKGLQATLTKVELAEARLNLMEKLSEAQIAIAQTREDLQACRDQVHALQAHIAQLEAFDADIENYELADTGRGALAYRPKDAPEAEEYGHWHCPHCFDRRQKSRMIPEDRGAYGLLRCHACKLDLHIFGHRPSGAR